MVNFTSTPILPPTTPPPPSHRPNVQSQWGPDAIATIVFGILMFLIALIALWQGRQRKIRDNQCKLQIQFPVSNNIEGIVGADLEENGEEVSESRRVVVGRGVAREMPRTSAGETQNVVLKNGQSRCEIKDLDDDEDGISELDITTPSRVETGDTLIGDEIDGKDGLEKLCDGIES